MKCFKNCLKDQLKRRKHLNIPYSSKINSKSGKPCWFAFIPMKRCLLSEGSNRDVQRRNRVSHENFANYAINTYRYVTGPILWFFKRTKFPTLLYNILGTSDMSDVEIDDPQYFSQQPYWKKAE